MSTTFESLGLKDEILQAVSQLGFVTPTEIQQKAIPMLLEDQTDLVGLAQTGTGKTAAFGLPLLNLIDFSDRRTQGLILCPTRELCQQIQNDLLNYSKYINGANIVAVYGGASFEHQLREIKRGCQVVVATPGRLIDLMQRKSINLSTVDFVVLDEADEMLNMGFKDDIDAILEGTPASKFVWLFSATMPSEVRRIASTYMENPREIQVGKSNTANTNIEHVYYVTMARNKYAALKRIVDFVPEIYGIIFTRTKMDAQETAEKLIKDGYNADALHGDLSQAQREKVMGRFRDRSLQLLIATDVAARGIDVNDITHVINYSLPDELEVYTHRSGRTARAGKKGISITIINSKEAGRIRQLEKATGAKFKKQDIPGGKEICEKQLFKIIQEVHDVEVNNDEIDPFLPVIYKRLEDLTKEDLIKRFASLEFNRFLTYYRNAPDLNIDAAGGGMNDRRDNKSWARFFISIGEKDGIDKTGLLKFLNQNGLGNYKVGQINVKPSFSFFEIDEAGADEVKQNLEGVRVGSRNVRVELETGPMPGGGGSERRERGSSDRGDRGGSSRGGSDRGGYGRSGGGSSNRGGGDRGGYSRGGSDRGGDRGGSKGGYGGGGGYGGDKGGKGKKDGAGPKKKSYSGPKNY